MRPLITLILCAFLTQGCFPTTPPAAPGKTTGKPAVQKSQATLIAELKEILRDPEANATSMQPYMICDELAMKGPTALAPIVQMLGEAETTPETMIFILQAININMRPSYLPFIEPLLDSQDPVTRSCATQLLGAIKTPESTELLFKLREDADHGIRFTAWSGLAQHEIEPQRTDFVTYYTDPEVSDLQKKEIIRIMVTNPKEPDTDIMVIALLEEDLVPPLRAAIVNSITDLGSSRHIAALHKSMELEPLPEYKNLIELAVARIKEREEL